ncbi:unnamed protein product [Hymenolepis diminuta]|uniref:Piwi domain-containing protein n=1 Tax=Hymenolepis diminuta TaxID=6216 RepID=A0A0R3SZC8_HYMDI|nr:unnamed protein product [Hymenolepis diminuta]
MIEGRNMSIRAYFKEQYGIELQYPELPCVKTKANREVYMPMELLRTLPFQDPKADVSSEMVRVAAVKPDQRFRKLQNFIKTIIKQSPLVKAMGLRLASQDPITTNARILPTPSITGSRVPVDKGAWWPTPFRVPAFREVKYAIILFVSDVSELDKMKRGIDQAGQQLGLQLVSGEEPRMIQPAQLSLYFKQLREKVSILSSSSFSSSSSFHLVKWDVKLAICILPKSEPYYSDIKRACEFEEFLVTQCIKEGTLTKRNPWPNILLKINGKLGGVNWELNEIEGYWRKEIVMVVGADAFYRKNNTLPTKILFYRDGVSEGQFSSVVEKELSAMQRACTKLRPGYQPGFTFIIVQKRHHIRFLPTEGGLINVKPGTIVDTNITHSREFDFYLCSHQGIQGTSKPAHYHIIYDDNNLGANELQLFSFYLSHVYMRCTRSVSYPAPTYYAHLAAFRGRDWMKGAPNPERLLENNQFNILPEQKDLMFFL